MKFNERLLLFTLAAVQFTHILDFMIMMPLGPQLMRIFGIGPQQFGFIVACYTISAGIFGFLGAFVIDRFDRKIALRTAYIGFIIGTIACGLAPDYYFLMAARILTGAFGGILGSLILSIIGDVIPNERRASAMGIVMASFSIATVLGVPIGLKLATMYSWHLPFLSIGVVGIIILFFIQRNIPSLNDHVTSVENRPAASTVITGIVADSNQLRALLLMIFLMFGQFTVIPFISPYMVSNVGFTEDDLFYIYMFGGIANIVAMPLIGKASDKYGKFKMFRIFVLISLFPIYAITNLPATAIPMVLVVTTLFFVCSGGRMIPAQAMITSTVSPKTRGSFMSINSSMQQFAAGLSSFIAGMIVSKNTSGQLENYHIVGYIALFASVCCILIASKIKVKSQ